MVNMTYLMTAFLFFSNTFCYVDRTNISVAVIRFGYSKAMQGIVLSSFFYGYLITQIPAGMLVPKYGPKKVLLCAILLWTLSDFSTIWSAPWPALLITMRILVGMGEGANFPCVYAFASAWFPKERKATLMSIVGSGPDLGSVLALAISPIVSGDYGWQYIFVISASLNTCWMILFLKFSRDYPEDSLKGGSKLNSKLPWKTFFKNRSCRAIFISHFCYNYSLFVLMGWIPAYYEQKLNFNLRDSSIFAALPYMFGYLGSLVAGFGSDFLINRGKYSITRTRKIMNSIGLFGGAIGLIILPQVSSRVAAVGILCMTMFLSRIATSGFLLNVLDVCPNHASQMMSITNTIATVPGILGNVLTGALLDAFSSWFAVFALSSVISFVGGVCYLLLSGSSDIATEVEEGEGEG
jgi:ACS family sodium-dependent inorganic phosphate cotransporter